MRANFYIIDAKKGEEDKRLNRAWDKFNLRRNLIRDIYDIHICIYNRCINCNGAQQEGYVFELSYRLNRYNWKCPCCDKINELYLGIRNTESLIKYQSKKDFETPLNL